MPFYRPGKKVHKAYAPIAQNLKDAYYHEQYGKRARFMRLLRGLWMVCVRMRNVCLYQKASHTVINEKGDMMWDCCSNAILRDTSERPQPKLFGLMCLIDRDVP